MAQHPYTGLSPNDAAVAIRSFERRFRQATQAADLSLDQVEPTESDPDEADLDEVANRPGASGRSALDHLALAAGRLELAAAEVQSALVTASHRVDPALAELEVAPQPSHSRRLDIELARLEKAADTLAQIIERSDSSWWLIARTTSDGGTATALELVQATVAFTLDRMHAIDAVLREVRGHPR